MRRNNTFLWLLSTCCLLTACVKNNDITHPNFDYQTVYFGTQFPVRTVELGEDVYVDNSLDNAHKVAIKATLGGTRDNTKNVEIEYYVDETLCNGLYFSATGAKVLPLPSSYYTLTSNKIVIPKGSILGGTEVQLTDAFFADPLSIQNTYAIPLVMKSVTGADSILRGTASVSNPNRCIDANWTIKPLDYVVYAVKFVNQWHGNYLRRGKDAVTYQGESVARDTARHTAYVETDEVVGLKTRSLYEVNLPVIFKSKTGANISCTLILNFNDKGSCTISSATAGITASGTGAFVKKGEKNSWGNQDRDALYLSYDVSMAQLTAKTTDTLVLRDRAVSPEYFTPVVK